MSTVTPQELLKAWKLEQMTVEMTMGHVVQNLVILRDEIDRLIAYLRLPPTTAITGAAACGANNKNTNQHQSGRPTPKALIAAASSSLNVRLERSVTQHSDS